MSGHTGGDWRVQDTAADDGQIRVDSTTDGAVAIIRAPWRGPVDPKFYADAHLIAAAPTMLKALLLTREIVIGRDALESCEGWVQELAKVWDAAISKAECCDDDDTDCDQCHPTGD